ncbi:hypothetical protein [Cellulomonas persica]|uniref:Uncharacterized protein n=1 Tax=Cellulomonas persica TaxID=76861 RepID=A0A510V0R8_9CELL|nr:hypothetical protein [Cellulomonas persica]GEK19401.1 hypothetical protein CPE01_31340 [Cellulomonas persica]
MATRLLLEGAELAALLQHVATELGPDARVVSAERVRSGGFAGFFQREHYELTVDVPDRVAAPPHPRLRRAAPASIEDLVDAADQADDASGLPGAPAVPVVSTGGEAFADVLAQVRALAGEGGGLPVAAHQSMRTEVVRTEVVASRPPEPQPEPFVRRLAELGVPESLLAHRPTTISAWAAALPPAPVPQRDPGRVLVVAGAPGVVDTTATLVADRLDLPSDAVVLAGTPVARAGTGRGRPTRQRPADAAAAEAWRATAGRAAHAWVVALAVGDGPDERQAGRDLLRAFAGDQAWAVVDARTRTADARAWLADVGPFDALAVRGLFDTAEPGAVLALDTPVAWFDGIPATPTAWASAFDRALDGGSAGW